MMHRNLHNATDKSIISIMNRQQGLQVIDSSNLYKIRCAMTAQASASANA